MKPALLYGLGLLILLGGIIFVSLRHPSSNPADSGKTKVVAAENFYGTIAKQLGGDQVNVTSILSDPNADPHLYESDARDADAVNQAAIVIKNGLGYDDFIDKLLAASPSTSRTVLSAETIANANPSTANPHLWYDLSVVQKIATQISTTLAAKDPGHESLYREKLQTFRTSLQPTIDLVDQIKTTFPGAPVAYTERVPGYLLLNAGLVVKTPAGFASAIEEGNEPNSQETVAFEQLIKNHQIRVLLYNTQATSAASQHIRDLADQAHIPEIGVSETIPANEQTYQSWQFDQTSQLLNALKQ